MYGNNSGDINSVNTSNSVFMIGGIVGGNCGSPISYCNVINNGDIISNNSTGSNHVGGLVANNYSNELITSCNIINNGTIKATGNTSYASFIIGNSMVSSHIETVKVINNKELYSDVNIGAITGYSVNTASLITDCTINNYGTILKNNSSYVLTLFGSTNEGTITNTTINNKIKTLVSEIQNFGTIKQNTSINIENGNIASFTVGANVTITPIIDKIINYPVTLTLYIINGGVYTVTWPTNISWEYNAPILKSSGIDVITLATSNNGKTWIGLRTMTVSI